VALDLVQKINSHLVMRNYPQLTDEWTGQFSRKPQASAKARASLRLNYSTPLLFFQSPRTILGLWRNGVTSPARFADLTLLGDRHAKDTGW